MKEYHSSREICVPQWMRFAVVSVVFSFMLVMAFSSSVCAWSKVTRVGSVYTGCSTESLSVQGDYAYTVSYFSSKLQVYNIANVVKPVLVGYANTGSQPDMVCVQGNYAYTTSQNRLMTFNISNPTAPTLTSSVQITQDPSALDIQGNYIYMIHSYKEKLDIYNISNPAVPALAGSVAISGDLHGIAVQDNYTYVTLHEGKLQVYDISNPVAPVFVGFVFTGKCPTSVRVQGKYAYVTAYSSGTLEVYNVSNSAKPVFTGSIETRGEPVSISVQGNYAYVTGCNSGKLQVFNISNSFAPTLAGSVSTKGNANLVDVQGKYAYVASHDNSVSHNNDSLEVYDVSDCASNPSIWYLAEGSTAWGFDCYISIENPNTLPVNVKLDYMTDKGPVSGPKVYIPARSQATVNPSKDLGTRDFSTKVACLEGKPIAADRTMIWTGEGASSPEAHSSIGVTAPSTTWYLPEGSCAWGFDCYLLIQNPNDITANCNVTWMIDGKEPVTDNFSIDPLSRFTIDMSDHLDEKDASIKVVSNSMVICERAMYRYNRREGHDSIGTTAPANDYYLAEGATGYGSSFMTYVLVQNPNDKINKVTITYLTGTGEVAGPTLYMDPNSRSTVRINDQLKANNDVSTRVHGTMPIIAERSMYWNSPAGETCHDSIGMSKAHKTFYFPDGQTSDGRETWTLVSNPNSTDVKVKISYLTSNGKGNAVFTETILAGSRKTFNMADKGIQGRAAVMVESLTTGKKILCERAMYWNSRSAGTDTIGGFSD